MKLSSSVCSVCGIELNELNKGKHSSKCKPCLTEYYRLRQQRRRKTIPEQKEYDINYRKEHPEVTKKSQKKYYKTHPEHFKEKNRKAYDRKKYIINERRRVKYKFSPEYRKKLNDCKKQYYQANKEKVINMVVKWQENHPALVKEYHRKSQLKPEHIKRQKEYVHKWDKDGIKRKIYRQNYQKNHPDYAKFTRKWEQNNPEKTKMKRKKSRDFRRREMGVIPLNSWFKGSHGHHIDSQHVIYIPSKLHMEYAGHNHKKPETMVEINKKAFFYLMNEMMS